MSFEYFFCVIRAMIIGKMSYINDFLICVILAKWTIKMGRREYGPMEVVIIIATLTCT